MSPRLCVFPLQNHPYPPNVCAPKGGLEIHSPGRSLELNIVGGLFAEAYSTIGIFQKTTTYTYSAIECNCTILYMVWMSGHLKGCYINNLDSIHAGELLSITTAWATA